VKACINRLIKIGIGHIFFRFGLYRCFLSQNAVVVAFHRVEASEARDGMTMPTNEFRDWCCYFARYFKVVSPMTLVEKLESKTPFSCELAITFDDGYLDFHSQAVPVMESLGITAAVFACSDFVGSDAAPWWDQQIHKHYPFMNWAELNEVSERGFVVGSHGKSHVGVDQLTPKNFHSEIALPKSVLELGLKRSVDLYAYPYGEPERMPEAARTFVQGVGYRACFGYGGMLDTNTSPFRMGRICVNDWFSSPAHFGGHLIVLSVYRIIEMIKQKFC